MNYKSISSTIFALVFLLQNCAASGDSSKSQARKNLYMVGSSTVSPLMAAVSEEFSRAQSLKKVPTETPVVEADGSRTGFKLFCSGVGYVYPDFANASRAIEESELQNCYNNGVKNVVEIKIGYDGIVIANSNDAKKVSLTKEQIFLALAEKVYDSKTKKLVKNPYKTWDQIDATLPKTEIIFYGPPLTSGTRDVFVDMVMEGLCMSKKEFSEVYKDHESLKAQCHKIRNDGRFIESGENDDLIVQALKSNRKAFGIFGFNFLIANRAVIQPVKINNIEPSAANIASKSYELSRPLFVYFKKEHLNLISGMRDFIKEIINPETIGRKGYLIHNGLVVMPEAELQQVRKNILSQL